MLLQHKRGKRGNAKFPTLFLSGKRGISIMIGYVLLVAGMLVMGGVVYAWMKSYVHGNEIQCPDDTSIFIKNFYYNSTAQILNLTLRNNGKFDINGYFIKASNDSEAKIAKTDLTSYIFKGGGYLNGAVRFEGAGILSPGEENVAEFRFNELDLNLVYIEIVPFRFQDVYGKQRLASCSNAKAKQTLCSPELVSLWECVKEGVGCLGDLNVNGNIDLDDRSAVIALNGKGCADPDNMPPCENCDAEYNPLADVYSVTQGDDFQDCDITMGDVLRIIQFFNQLKSCGQNYSLTRDTAGCFSDVVVENKSCYYA